MEMPLDGERFEAFLEQHRDWLRHWFMSRCGDLATSRPRRISFRRRRWRGMAQPPQIHGIRQSAGLVGGDRKPRLPPLAAKHWPLADIHIAARKRFRSTHRANTERLQRPLGRINLTRRTSRTRIVHRSRRWRTSGIDVEPAARSLLRRIVDRGDGVAGGDHRAAYGCPSPAGAQSVAHHHAFLVSRGRRALRIRRRTR